MKKPFTAVPEMRAAEARPQPWSILVGFLAILIGGCNIRESGSGTGRGAVATDLGSLKELILAIGKSPQDGLYVFPKGDSMELTEWLKSGCESLGKRKEVLDPLIAACPYIDKNWSVELRDRWGRQLVYDSVPECERYVFRLYSAGPNGRDDGGQGDDIDVSLEWKTLRDMGAEAVMIGGRERRERE